MAQAIRSKTSQGSRRLKQPVSGRRPGDALPIAEQQGIQSDSKLIEAALANVAVADEYADWLLAQRGSVKRELDIEL